MLVRRHEAFLEQVAAFARAMWTQFHAPSMIGGLALILLALALQATVLRARQAGAVPQLTILAAHGVSLFSNSYILEEGRVLVFFAASSFLFSIAVPVRWTRALCCIVMSGAQTLGTKNTICGHTDRHP